MFFTKINPDICRDETKSIRKVMAEFRIRAVKESESHRPVPPTIESGRYSEIFGKNVFNEDAMRQYLSRDAFKAVMAAINTGARINRENAKQVASGMKQWAM